MADYIYMIITLSLTFFRRLLFFWFFLAAKYIRRQTFNFYAVSDFLQFKDSNRLEGEYFMMRNSILNKVE